jgi:hypothetical protein
VRSLHSRVCPACNVPGIWARDIALDGDNTSLKKKIPVRGVFYETGEIEHFIRGMEASLGVSLGKVVFSAHKRAVRRFFSGTLRGINGSLARVLAPRLIYRRQAEAALDFGVGRVSVAGYRRGGPLEVEAANVWDERLFAAGVAGAFEAVEGVGCEVDTEKAGGTYRFTARRGGDEEPEDTGKLIQLTGVLSGERKYPRCHGCGAPISFQVFSWDRERGEVRERDNCIRVVYQAAACFDSLLRGMEIERGEELHELAIRTQADFVRDMIVSGAYDVEGETRIDKGRKYFDQLGLIRRRCMGNPVNFDYGPGSLRVSIRNPASEALVTGRVLGTFEGVEGGKGFAGSSSLGGTLKVEVSST